MQVKSIFVFGALFGPFVFSCVVLSISSHEWANMGFHLHVAQFYQKTLIPLKEGYVLYPIVSGSALHQC